MNLGANLKTTITAKSACGQYFYDDSIASAAFFEERNNIGIDIKKQTLDSYTGSLGELEHEVIHAIQQKESQSMPIELREYEAYIAGANVDYLQENPEVIKMLFQHMVGGSVSSWYQEEGTRPKWDNPIFFLKNIDKLPVDSLTEIERKFNEEERIKELRESFKG
ncbi:MAG: hypothetical protein WCW56_03745 [Candidatus Paceibacterota bacterium]|jgi:hypothetical protein